MIKKSPLRKYLPWLALIAICFIVCVNTEKENAESFEDKERTVTHSWKEEVLLDNNHVILVQRHQKIHIKPIKNSYDEVTVHEMSLEIISDNIKNLPLKWEYPLAPIFLDYDQEKNEWFIIATRFSKSTEGNESIQQRSPFIKFIFVNNQWTKSLRSVGERYVDYISNILAFETENQKMVTLLEKRKIIIRQHAKGRLPSNYFCATLVIIPPYRCSKKRQLPEKYYTPLIYYNE